VCFVAIAAVVLAGAAAYLSYEYAHKADTRAQKDVQRVDVLVAKNDISKGTTARAGAEQRPDRDEGRTEGDPASVGGRERVRPDGQDLGRDDLEGSVHRGRLVREARRDRRLLCGHPEGSPGDHDLR